jgi:hypothetical protein
MRINSLFALGLLWALPAGAQCLGDFNSDGSVAINEIITAVNNALNDCGRVAPTPTVPVGGARCPRTFLEDVTTGPTLICSFTGGFNTTTQCAGQKEKIAWAGDGEAVLFLLYETDPPVVVGGTVSSAREVELLGWSTDFFQNDGTEMSGKATQKPNGVGLVIAPSTPPFAINGCPFKRYDAPFDRLITEPVRRAVAPPVLDRAALTRFVGWMRDREAGPLPELRSD